ncbi:MAG: hypothetical protein ACHQ9S_16995 [Candidatus Binatia bacterium]
MLIAANRKVGLVIATLAFVGVIGAGWFYRDHVDPYLPTLTAKWAAVGSVLAIFFLLAGAEQERLLESSVEIEVHPMNQYMGIRRSAPDLATGFDIEWECTVRFTNTGDRRTKICKLRVLMRKYAIGGWFNWSVPVKERPRLAFVIGSLRDLNPYHPLPPIDLDRPVPNALPSVDISNAGIALEPHASSGWYHLHATGSADRAYERWLGSSNFLRLEVETLHGECVQYDVDWKPTT